MRDDRTPTEPTPDGTTDTESYRMERGEDASVDPRDRMGDVPLAFGQGGVLRGHGTEEQLPAGGASDAAADVAAAQERQGLDDDR